MVWAPGFEAAVLALKGFPQIAGTADPTIPCQSALEVLFAPLDPVALVHQAVDILGSEGQKRGIFWGLRGRPSYGVPFVVHTIQAWSHPKRIFSDVCPMV